MASLVDGCILIKLDWWNLDSDGGREWESKSQSSRELRSGIEDKRQAWNKIDILGSGPIW